jgi:hypothetical protein
MKRAGDVYSGHRAKDWLERQHINHVRRKIRAARKRENQLLLALEDGNARLNEVAHVRQERNGS